MLSSGHSSATVCTTACTMNLQHLEPTRPPLSLYLIDCLKHDADRSMIVLKLLIFPSIVFLRYYLMGIQSVVNQKIGYRYEFEKHDSTINKHAVYKMIFRLKLLFVLFFYTRVLKNKYRYQKLWDTPPTNLQ